MIFSIRILGPCAPAVLRSGMLMLAAALLTGCGQRGPLFLAPQSVPYSVVPAVAPASASAPAPAAPTSASGAK